MPDKKQRGEGQPTKKELSRTVRADALAGENGEEDPELGIFGERDGLGGPNGPPLKVSAALSRTARHFRAFEPGEGTQAKRALEIRAAGCGDARPAHAAYFHQGFRYHVAGRSACRFEWRSG